MLPSSRRAKRAAPCSALSKHRTWSGRSAVRANRSRDRAAGLRVPAAFRIGSFSESYFAVCSLQKIRPQRKPDCVVRAYGKVTPGGIGCACTSYPWSSYRGVFRGTCCRMCSLQSFQLRICFQWCKYSGFLSFTLAAGYFLENLSRGRNFVCQRCDCDPFC